MKKNVPLSCTDEGTEFEAAVDALPSKHSCIPEKHHFRSLWHSLPWKMMTEKVVELGLTQISPTRTRLKDEMTFLNPTVH